MEIFSLPDPTRSWAFPHCPFCVVEGKWDSAGLSGAIKQVAMSDTSYGPRARWKLPPTKLPAVFLVSALGGFIIIGS